MRIPRCRRFLRALTALAPIALAAPAGAQRLIQYSADAGEVGGEVRTARRTGRDGVPLDDRSYQQWVRLPFNGTVFMPQFLTYGVVLRPVFGRQSMLDGTTSMNVRDMGIDYNAVLLAGRPLSATTFGNRTSGGVRGTGRGENAHRSATFGATVKFRNPWMPLGLSWTRRSLADSWQPLPTIAPMRRNEAMKLLRLEGQSSRTTVSVERAALDDRAGALSFAGTTAAGTHTLRWGRGSSLVSATEWARRTGNDAQRRFEWSEQLRVQHAQTVSTDVGLGLRSAVTGPRATGGHSMTLATTAQPWAGVRTTLRASTQSDRYGLDRVRWHTLAPRADASRTIRGLTVSGAMLASYEHQARSVGGARRHPVLGERQLVDEARVVVLREQFIDPATVVVRSADGARLFLEGIDYRLVPVGPTLQLYLLQGGRIDRGDLLEITYEFRSAASRSVERYGGSMDLTVARAGWVLNHAESWYGARASGAIAPDQLPTASERSTMLGLHRPIRGVRLDAELRHRARRQFRNRMQTIEGRGTILGSPTAAIQLSLAANASRTYVERVPLDLGTMNATVGWQPGRGLRLQGSAERWVWRSAAAPAERLLGGSLDVEWRVGRLETTLRYGLQDRVQRNGGSEQRLSLRLVRRF